MKKTLILLAIVLSVVLGAASARAAEITLSFTAAYMERHPVVQNVWLPWAAEIKKRTNGKVEILFYNPNTICAEAENFEAARKGQISIGHNGLARNQGRLPVSVVVDTPSSVTTPMAASAALWKLYEEFPEIQKEYEGMHILAMHTSAPIGINWANGSAKKLEDMKGKKVLVYSGDLARAMRPLGTNTIVTPATDYYLSLSRNMADACVLPIAPLRSMKLNEVTKSVTSCNLMMTGFWMGMNQSTWDSLPEDAKKAFNETTGLEFSIAIGKALYDADQADRKLMEKDGTLFNDLSTEERARWVAATAPVFKDLWFEQMQKRGVGNAQKIYDRMAQLHKECEEKYSPKKM